MRPGLLEFAERARTQISTIGVIPKLQRIAARMDKAGKVTLPDGSAIYQPLLRRPELRNAMTTADDFVRDLEALVAKGPIVITHLQVGEPAERAPVIHFMRRHSEPDSRPCDSERSE